MLKQELQINPKSFGKDCNSSGCPSALVVDDDRANRRVLNSMLAKLGYDVIEAEDGFQAIECFMKAPPDIVLIDILMPGMDGYEVTSRIRSLYHHNLLPIIFVSAYTDERTLARCIEVGGDDVLIKPFSLTLLKSKIRAIERMHNLSRESDLLYQAIKQDEVIAEKVFNAVVFSNNVAREIIQTFSQSIATFSGDILLTAYTPTNDLHILLGDFTGHGLTAALGALPVSDVFRAMTARGFPPEKILQSINRKLHDLMPTQIFLAAQFVSIGAELKQVNICNCGMPDILILSGQSGEIRERVKSSCVPLGIDPYCDITGAFTQVSITGGERLLLVSDGITETVNQRGEQFGQDRFESVIANNAGSQFVLHAICDELDAHRGNSAQTDDLSVVEIPCIPAIIPAPFFDKPVTTPVSSSTDAGFLFETQSDAEWVFTLALNVNQVKKTNPVPLIVGQIEEIEGTNVNKAMLFTVLTELYVNALDHGLLGLDSSLKTTSDGFADYFEEKESRINSLRQGSLRFSVRGHRCIGSGRIVIRVEDSGPGFDYKAFLHRENFGSKYYGRGIPLLQELCESLRFDDPGNKAEVVLVWVSK